MEENNASFYRAVDNNVSDSQSCPFFFLWIIFSRIQSYKAVAWQRNLAKATAILEIYDITLIEKKKINTGHTKQI